MKVLMSVLSLVAAYALNYIYPIFKIAFFVLIIILLIIYWLKYHNANHYTIRLTEEDLHIRNGFKKKSFRNTDITSISYLNTLSNNDFILINTDSSSSMKVPLMAFKRLEWARIIYDLEENNDNVSLDFNLYDFIHEEDIISVPIKRKGNKLSKNTITSILVLFLIFSLLTNMSFGTIIYSASNIFLHDFKISDLIYEAKKLNSSYVPNPENIQYKTVSEETTEENIFFNEAFTFEEFDQLAKFDSTLVISSDKNKYNLNYSIPYLSSENVAVYKVDNEYIVESTGSQWSYSKEFSTEPDIKWIINSEGIKLFNSLSEEECNNYNTKLRALKLLIDKNEALKLCDFTDSNSRYFNNYSDIVTWGDYLDQLRAYENPEYKYDANHKIHDFPNVTMVTIKNVNKGSYIKIKYGEEYGQLYVYKYGNSYSPFDNKYYSLYTEIAKEVYSFKIDSEILEFKDKILDLSKDMKLNSKAPLSSVLEVNDFAVERIRYSKDTVPYDNHTAAKALYEGEGVCESYASLVTLLLNTTDVESYFIATDDSDDDNSRHAYNMILVDDKLMYFDSTWADNETYTDFSYYNFSLDQHPQQPYTSSYYNGIIENYESKNKAY